MMKETSVKVGILKAESLKVVFRGEYTLCGNSFVGEHLFTMADVGKTFTPSSEDASFVIENVVIGIDFHWERKENQAFRGMLSLIEEDGMLRAVNIVPVETYLTSVISSEMSANASLELLKAHAVISRSWLLRQIQRCDRDSSGNDADMKTDTNGSEIIRWYDSEGHTLFDVCADDHCQRYQGITRQTNPNVTIAINATRGQVLMYDGNICDARFSKCCGGMMELFENCWQPANHPYLQAKPDPYCNTTDKRVLAQVLNNYDQETVNFYRWSVRYTNDEISKLLHKKSGIDFGCILDMQPVETGPSGRIVRLKIIGEKRTVIVGKELEIRKWLSPSHLYSSAFDVVKTDDGFMLKGKGWGHGVGLCQIGAAVMGDKGIPYTEILQHYYPGAELEAIY